MSEAIEVLARRRLALVEQRESVQAAIDAIDAQLTDAIEVGGAVMVGDQPVFRVSQRSTFKVEKALEILPAEMIEAATVPTLDVKRLKGMMPPALVEACSVAGRPFVSAVKS